MKRLCITLALNLVIGFASAALHDRGSGLIYDDVYDITWLADANYAKTSGFDEDGLMEWPAANDWVASLVFAGASAWRLPSTLKRDGTGNCVAVSACTGSELGFMYFVNLGVAFGDGLKTSTNPSFGLILNLPEMPNRSTGPDHGGAVWYWMAPLERKDTNSPAFNVAYGWVDLFQLGFHQGYVWPVHDGDIAAVPEPSTYLLMLAGIALVGYGASRHNCS